MMKRIMLALGLMAGSAVGQAEEIEEPQWQLIDTVGKVELRRYAARVQAVTELEDSGQSSAGFRRLAGFIFGGNEREQSIAMTAPVQETLQNERPLMTFTMPRGYALAELPAPDDRRVRLVAVPEQTVAAIRCSGWATRGKIGRMTRERTAVLAEHGIAVAGRPMLNQYNPPWTPPLFRRNEITLAIDLPEQVAGR